MASTPIEVYYDPGKTLTCDLYQQGSDTLAVGGVTLTEATNRDGVYDATIVNSLTGYYTVHVIENSRTRAIYDIKLVNDTNKYYSQAVGSNVQNVFNALINAIVGSINTAVTAIKAKTDQLTFSTANQVDATTIDNQDKFGYRINGTIQTLDSLHNFDPDNDTVDVGKINGSTSAATNLQYLNDAVIPLTVDDATFTPTTTAFETDGTITDDDTLIGMAGTWFNSSGDPANTGTYFIEDSEGTTTNANNKLKITTETMPAAPADGDVFVILGSRVR